MIEWAGTAFALAKEVYEYLKSGKDILDTGKGVLDAGKEIIAQFEVHELDPKLVDFSWPHDSGFAEQALADGYEVAWSRPDRIAARELTGYQVMYEVDKAAKTRRRLVLRDGLTLIGRKTQN